jgi:hypothetical protein
LSNFEKVQSNWSTYEKLLGRLESDAVSSLIESLGERVVIAPRSQKKDQVGCFAGGLVQHALDVTIMMKTLNESMGFNVPISSILKVGLLHELGKIGDLESDLFIEQDSEWHREKLGQMYKYNEDLGRMSVSHRTLYLLQSFGISLTSDEWIGIQLSQGSHFEENRFYVGHEPTIAVLIQLSKSAVIHRSSL